MSVRRSPFLAYGTFPLPDWERGMRKLIPIATALVAANMAE